MSLKRSVAFIIIFSMLLAMSVFNVSADEKYTYDPGNGKCVYVSDNGSDSNDGSEKSPYKTLKKAYSVLSNSANTAQKSGGYIIIKDTLTIFDSEGGKVDSVKDNGRYTYNFTSNSHQNKITICGETPDSKLIFGNSYGAEDYRKYQGVITAGGPLAFENLEFTYSNGRVTFISTNYLRIDDSVSGQSSSNDFYINAAGTLELFGGYYAHVFAPHADMPTTVSVGGTAVIGRLWTGLGSITQKVTIGVYGDCQIEALSLGGQASTVTGSQNLFITGGKVGSISIYSTVNFKGDINVFYSGIPSGAPAVAADAKLYIFDESSPDEVDEDMSVYTFDGMLKANVITAPSAKISNGYITKCVTYELLDKGGKSFDFPFENYVMNLPEEFDISDNYRIYAYDGSAYKECELISSGEVFTFKPVGSAKSYALVHMGSEAPKAPVKQETVIGGVDVIENPLVGPSDPYVPVDDTPDTEGGMNITLIIIICIIAVTVVCEAVILLSGKKKAAK